MATMVKLKCPGCWETFKVELNGIPRFCPLCGYDTAEDEAADARRMAKMLDEQKPPHYTRQIKSTVDNLYRDTEVASEYRAQVAADEAGVDVSEMASLKVTNMNDSLREGDIAHVEVNKANPSVGQAMQATPGLTGYTRDPQINSYRSGSVQGPNALSGLTTMGGMQRKFFGRTPEHFDGKGTSIK